MSLLPQPTVDLTTTQALHYPTCTFGIDRSSGRVTGMVDGLAAMRQAVDIALSIDRYRWTIYSANYGSELRSLIGQSSDLATAELARMVQDALSVDDRVTGVTDFVLSVAGNVLYATFTVHTVYGPVSAGTQVVL